MFFLSRWWFFAFECRLVCNFRPSYVFILEPKLKKKILCILLFGYLCIRNTKRCLSISSGSVHGFIRKEYFMFWSHTFVFPPIVSRWSINLFVISCHMKSVYRKYQVSYYLLFLSLPPPAGQRRKLHRQRLEHCRNLHRFSLFKVCCRVNTLRNIKQKYINKLVYSHLNLLTFCYFVLFNYRETNPIIKHYHIKVTQSSPPQFYLAEKHLFDSIPDLVEYHKHNAAGKQHQISNLDQTQSVQSPKAAVPLVSTRGRLYKESLPHRAPC